MFNSILLDAINLNYIGAAIGAGIVTIGAGLGLGKIGTAAMDAMARQPEAISKIQTPMIIIGALLEGVSLIGAVSCMLIVFLK